MLRITEVAEATPDGRVVRTLRVEGALRGAWVAELRRAWRLHGRAPVRVELADVQFVDAAGKLLLVEMYRAGVDLVAHGLLCAAIRDEIVAVPRTTRRDG